MSDRKNTPQFNLGLKWRGVKLYSLLESIKVKSLGFVSVQNTRTCCFFILFLGKMVRVKQLVRLPAVSIKIIFTACNNKKPLIQKISNWSKHCGELGIKYCRNQMKSGYSDNPSIQAQHLSVICCSLSEFMLRKSNFFVCS